MSGHGAHVHAPLHHEHEHATLKGRLLRGAGIAAPAGVAARIPARF